MTHWSMDAGVRTFRLSMLAVDMVPAAVPWVDVNSTTVSTRLATNGTRRRS